MTYVPKDRVAALRAFNRSYAKVAGFLDAGVHGSRFSGTEAKVIFELAQRDVMEVGELRSALDIDAGQLSRVMTKMEGAGLIERTRSTTDARRHLATLSAAGREAFAELDKRSVERAEQLLGALSDGDQLRLVDDLQAAWDLLVRSVVKPTYVVRDLRPGDLGWVVHRSGVLHTTEYGWEAKYEARVARFVADFGEHQEPGRENGWVLEEDGRPRGSVFCVRSDDDVARIRMMHVEPGVQDAGVGARLVEECVRFARAQGYKALIAWTDNESVVAQGIYKRAGFVQGPEAASPSGRHGRLGPTWRLDL